MGEMSHIAPNPQNCIRLKKGHWFLTYEKDVSTYGKVLTEDEVKELLIKSDLAKYEELFGELEEG